MFTCLIIFPTSHINKGKLKSFRSANSGMGGGVTDVWDPQDVQPAPRKISIFHFKKNQLCIYLSTAKFKE